MTLLPGCRITVASKFHLEADWSARLSLGAGVEELGGRFFPRGTWRAPSAPDLAVLVVGDAPSTSLPLLGADESPSIGQGPDAPDAISLFQIPGHLRETWWDLLNDATESDGPMCGFDVFAARVNEFLAFKRLDIPVSARMEAIVTAAGERSIRRDPNNGQPSGLGPTTAPWTPWPLGERVTTARLWGIVNLGDEPTGVVLLNLTLANLGAELARRTPGEAAPVTVADLVTRFLRTLPDYPLVRVRLGPGEGCRLPLGGLILDGDPTQKQEPDLLLLISEDGAEIETAE